jgi:hypothetical protein
MIRLNLAWWCRIASAIADITTAKAGDPFAEFYSKGLPAAQVIWANHSDGAIVSMRTSNQAAIALLTFLGKMWQDTSRTVPVSSDEAAQIQKLVRDYQTVLEAELQTLDAYYVTQKGVFSTRHLTENAEAILPPEMQAVLSDETKADIRAGGRCLAFELPTAAGFHIARATESVVTWWMGRLGCPSMKESQRNWGAYIKALRERKVDEKITHHLEQVKDLHRNPLIHPEETLTQGEALLLWNACIGLIAAMVTAGQKANGMPTPPEPTGASGTPQSL